MNALHILTAVAVLVIASPVVAMDAYTRTPIDVRDAPNEAAEVVALLFTGSKVDMTHCTDGWCLVLVGGAEGWLPETELMLRGHAR